MRARKVRKINGSMARKLLIPTMKPVETKNVGESTAPADGE